MIITRQRTGQSAGLADEALVDGDKLIIDRAVYKQLSSLTDMKVLTTPPEASDEFNRFLLEMNKLHAGESVSSDIEALDAYLGSLGLTLTYPFSEDTYDSEAWIESIPLGDSRNVSTISGGTEYNVITNIGGVDYNVLHDTSNL